ncbi:DUF3995 domain-containing protein [Spongiactinospora rosea]|uniref:DUF3995 domain-containing protein n=1 Tax=Spongiactinospora rosea TaxID=2248750 RepID=A0A366LZF8_9ACTN|nr:DUF3995 domain-containing protein [Spongiactinospora rosea]RBQ19147.1 DUF3995 domain-containing protein [Spongiactinospora rosea]
MPRPDRTRLGAYGAAALCVAYGSMKLAQALGATALADKDPLPPEARARLLARDPMFVASHWALAGAAVAGVIVALLALRPWSGSVPRRLLMGICWTVGIFMIARSVGVLGFGVIGDATLLTGLRPPPPEHAALARELAWWDLLLWSPFFLLWGTCWTVTGWRLRRT